MGISTIPEKIRSFTDLNAWKEGHQLVLEVYKQSEKFPNDERFCLIDQIRRSVISITSNIAEGFSRFGKNEKRQFYRIALGSLTELQNQLLIARDLGYLTKSDFDRLAELTITVSKLINGLLKSVSKTLNT